jgi:HK97 family phage major capsid protein
VAEIRGADDKKTADAARKAEIEEAVKAVLKGTRDPSLAARIGTGSTGEIHEGRLIEQAAQPPHPALKALFRDYRSGEIGTAFGDMVFGMKALDFGMVGRGKAKLDELGMYFGDLPPESKATLGNTGAAGGYVLPNNLVDTVVKPNTQEAIYQDLVTVRNGVNVRGVDQPYRTGAPSRMQFQNWGATKENVDEAYGTYSAALGTMARIYDVGKQYLRFSAGSAEQDVMDELGKAAILGENYYMIAGAGTGTTGTGDPTAGLYTVLNTAPTTYSSTPTTAASSSTLLGSFANILTQVQSKLAGRNRDDFILRRAPGRVSGRKDPQCDGPSGCQLIRLFASCAANRPFTNCLACCSPTSATRFCQACVSAILAMKSSTRTSSSASV